MTSSKRNVFRPLLFCFVAFLLSLSFASAQTPASLIDRTYSFKFQTKVGGGPATHLQFLFGLPQGISVLNQNDNVRFQDGVMYLKGPDVMNPGDSFEQQFMLRGTLQDIVALEATPLPFIWRDDFFVAEGSVDLSKIIITNVATPNIVRQAQKIIADLRANPEVVRQVQQVGVPVSVTLGAVGVGILTTTAASSSAPFAFNMIQLFRFLALGFLRFKRAKPWGKVYSDITGNPIVGALVKIYDTEFKKIKETQITDREGRFGFLVAPGTYFLKINKKGFAEYESETLRIRDLNEAINLSLALKPLVGDVPKQALNTIRALNALKGFFDLLNPYLFVFGTALSAFVAVIIPGAFNYGVLGLYVALDAVKIILSRMSLKSFGVVTDKLTHTPIPLSVVRVFDEKSSWLLGTRVTDALGRFSFLLLPGSYYVTSQKTQYKPFQSASIPLKKSGIIAFDVKLERLR